MSKKFQYWVDYSSLDFSADIVKAPIDMDEDEVESLSGARSGIKGPFSKLSEAKKEAYSLIDGDIGEFRRMKREVKMNKPIVLGDEEEEG